MSSSSLGKLFTITSFGESHGRLVGSLIDGCPAGLPLSEADIQPELDRRRPGASAADTTRREADQAEILSGVFNGFTTGAPICLVIWNRDADSSQYEKIRPTPRPGQADYTASVRYGGFNDYRGGGIFSGRLTAALVMAGAVARKLLAIKNIEIIAHTVAIGGVNALPQDIQAVKAACDRNPLRCADPEAAAKMLARIEQAREEGDSLGGIIETVALNVPVGLGEPLFDTVDGELAKAVLGIPAIKGVEFGSGFSAASRYGSENNDDFIIKDGQIATATNNAGGILGGISTGEDITLRVAVKATPTISIDQKSVDMETMEETVLSAITRRDASLLPRIYPVIEAMSRCVILDQLYMWRAWCSMQHYENKWRDE